MTTIADYCESIRISLERIEARTDASQVPDGNLKVMLQGLDLQADRIAEICRIELALKDLVK